MTETVTDKNKAFCKLLKAYTDWPQRKQLTQIMCVYLILTSGFHFYIKSRLKKPQSNFRTLKVTGFQNDWSGGKTKSQSPLISMHELQIWTTMSQRCQYHLLRITTYVKREIAAGRCCCRVPSTDLLSPVFSEVNPRTLGAITILISPEVKLPEEAVWRGYLLSYK